MAYEVLGHYIISNGIKCQSCRSDNNFLLAKSHHENILIRTIDIGSNIETESEIETELMVEAESNVKTGSDTETEIKSETGWKVETG